MNSLTVNGTELWYVDHGAGIPLVLVHGFPLNHTMWEAQIDVLAGLALDPVAGEPDMPIPSVRIIAPDLRGFGHSPASGEKVTMEQFADDLAAFLDGLGVREKVVLCGLSMGGYIAFQFYRKYASRLRGLVLCDTRAVADTPEVAAARYVMADRVLKEGPAPLVETMLSRLLSETTFRNEPDVVEQLRDMMMANNPRGIAAAARGMAERPDMTASLGQIACPTLVIVGENDASSTPAEMRGIAEAIPDAQFVEIAGAGHMAPMENAIEVNGAIIGFVEKLLGVESPAV